MNMFMSEDELRKAVGDIWLDYPHMTTRDLAEDIGMGYTTLTRFVAGAKTTLRRDVKIKMQAWIKQKREQA